jgi:hypothetical protein
VTGSHPPSGDSTDTLCVLPWIHLSTTVDGVWGRCCFDATNDYDNYYQQAEQPVFELVPDALGCLPHSRYASDNPDRAYQPPTTPVIGINHQSPNRAQFTPADTSSQLPCHPSFRGISTAPNPGQFTNPISGHHPS